MRIGDIYKNLWAGYESYFVYTGKTVRKGRGSGTDTQGYGITNIGGKWRLDIVVYDTQKLQDQEHFPIVGHIDFEEQKKTFIEEVINSVKKEYRERIPHACEYCKNRYVPLDTYPCSRCDRNEKPTDLFEAVI